MKGEFDFCSIFSGFIMWSICRDIVLNVTKKDFIKLHAQDWLEVDVWWSKNGHYDCLSTKKQLSLGIR